MTNEQAEKLLEIQGKMLELVKEMNHYNINLSEGELDAQLEEIDESLKTKILNMIDRLDEEVEK